MSDIAIDDPYDVEPAAPPAPAPILPIGSIDFDPSRFRLSQDYGTTLGTKKMIITVPVRKPTKLEFIRTHPAEAYRMEAAIIEPPGEDGRDDLYLLTPQVAQELPGLVKPVLLFTTINRQGVLFVWPCRLPTTSKRDEWSRSHLECAVLAQKTWVSVRSNQSLGAYEPFPALGAFAEPVWPDLTFDRILGLAFRDKQIESTDHPVVRAVLGAI
jgi:hypothetical protein